METPNLKDLKTISLLNVISGLENDELTDMFSNCDKSTLFNMKSILDKVVNNYVEDIYVATASMVSKKFIIRANVFNFLRKYRPEWKSDYSVVRHDPILIITYWLLRNDICFHNSLVEIDRINIKPFEKFIIRTNSSRINEYIEIMPSLTPRDPIPDRPLNLYEDIKKFAKVNGYELSTNLDKYPKTGPYRIFD